MRARCLPGALGALAAILLVWPTPVVADHVGVDGSVGATVERFGEDSWSVKVSFAVNCRGVGAAGASYQGDLHLIDLDTAASIYLGGVFGPSGVSTQLVHSTDRWQRLAPVLSASCFDNGNLHGSGTVKIAGKSVLIPPQSGSGSGGGGGGSRGGGGSGGGSSNPTEPLGPDGCRQLLVGTSRPDTLMGGAAGDVIFGLGKGDRMRGAGGHDCLIGGSGADSLLGEEGFDRLIGGRGRDRLVGGPGRNFYDAGRGRDFVDAANGRSEHVRCGPGRDRARVDRGDVTVGCETLVRRSRRDLP
jgi:RTX calcium-binding nonapeptide repeat (4 copies)